MRRKFDAGMNGGAEMIAAIVTGLIAFVLYVACLYGLSIIDKVIRGDIEP